MKCSFCKRECDEGHEVESDTPLSEVMSPSPDGPPNVKDVDINMGPSAKEKVLYTLCGPCHNRLLLQVIKTVRKANG